MTADFSAHLIAYCFLGNISPKLGRPFGGLIFGRHHLRNFAHIFWQLIFQPPVAPTGWDGAGLRKTSQTPQGGGVLPSRLGHQFSDPLARWVLFRNAHQYQYCAIRSHRLQGRLWAFYFCSGSLSSAPPGTSWAGSAVRWYAGIWASSCTRSTATVWPLSFICAKALLIFSRHSRLSGSL